jgi:hypothetical protein
MNQKLSLAIGFLMLGIIGYYVFEVFSWLATAIKDVNPSVGAALIAGVATVISSVFIASYNSRKAKERVSFEAHREKKADIYNEFMSMVIELMRNTKEGKEGNDVLPKDIEEFFYNFTAKITVYGGPGAVKAYANWRTESSDDQTGTKGLLLVDKLFREMRTDLGESNKGIDANELLGLFIIGGKSEVAKQANKAINTDS